MLKCCYQKHVIYFFVLLILVNTGCHKGVEDLPISTPPQDTVPTSPQTQKKWIVSTVAGTGEVGNNNGAGSFATFNYPTYLAVDTAGDLFVSDTHNFLIRKISNGIVTTFNGLGISNPYPAFGNIAGLVFDNRNNLYDIEYSLIRKYGPGTSSSIFSGGLEVSYKDGDGTSARFNVIDRIATDQSGNLFVPDFDMNTDFHIRKVTPQGSVSTIPLFDSTGFSTGSSSNSFYLSAIAADLSGNLYFTSNRNSLIKKADPMGNVTVFAGAGDVGFVDGKGSSAKFSLVNSLTTDSLGNIYVVDGLNSAIRKITTDGTVSTLAGGSGSGFKDGDATKALFLFPTDIAIDHKTGIIYIADSGNQRIRKIEFK